MAATKTKPVLPSMPLKTIEAEMMILLAKLGEHTAYAESQNLPTKALYLRRAAGYGYNCTQQMAMLNSHSFGGL